MLSQFVHLHAHKCVFYFWWNYLYSSCLYESSNCFILKAWYWNLSGLKPIVKALVSLPCSPEYHNSRHTFNAVLQPNWRLVWGYILVFSTVTASGNDFNIPPLVHSSVSAWMITTYRNGSNRTYYRRKILFYSSNNLAIFYTTHFLNPTSSALCFIISFNMRLFVQK